METVKLEAVDTKSHSVSSTASSSGAGMDSPGREDCFFSKLEDVLENAEIIIIALRDLTYSSADLSMGDTAEDVEEFLSQVDKFRGRIQTKKEEERRSRDELKQRLMETEAKLRDLEHFKAEELKKSEDKLEVLRKEAEVKFADLEKSKREEMEKLENSLSENEVNLEMMRMESKNLEDKLKSCEEEVNIFKNELDLIKKEKLEGERKLEALSVQFQLVLETLRDNGIVLREREPTPELSQYFLSLASELAGDMEEEWREMKVLNSSKIGGEGMFKTEETSLPLPVVDGDDSSEESEDGEEMDHQPSKVASTSKDSKAPEEIDKQSEPQSGPVDNQTSVNASEPSEPAPKRSTRQKKKKVVFSPDREEPPRKTSRMERAKKKFEDLKGAHSTIDVRNRSFVMNRN